MEQSISGYVELTVSDQSQLGPLQKFLTWAAPDAKVSRIAGQPISGEQGALDVLAVIASSSGLVAAVRTLPEFIRARRANLSVTMNFKGQSFTLTAANVDEIVPILERLLSA